jgi:hypothetical protein
LLGSRLLTTTFADIPGGPPLIVAKEKQILTMRLRIIASDRKPVEQLVTAAVIRIGRDPDSEVPFDPDAFPTVSIRHARIDRTASGDILTPSVKATRRSSTTAPSKAPSR